MKHKTAIALSGTILTVVAFSAGGAVASAAPTDDIKADLQKLSNSANYTWTTTNESIFGLDQTDGKTEKNGLTTLDITRSDGNVYAAVKQGDRYAVKTRDGWKSSSELGAANRVGGAGGGLYARYRWFASTARDFRAPATEALALADQLQNVQKTGDVYTADVTDGAAMHLPLFIRGHRKSVTTAPARTVSIKATAKIWTDGTDVTKIEIHAVGTEIEKGNEYDMEYATTTVFKDVGSTSITIPGEAKAKLDVQPATQQGEK